MKIFIVRNAEYVREQEGVWADQQTILSAIGEKQARLLAERLIRENPLAVYSSTAVRAIETIEPLTAKLGLRVTELKEFNSLDVGRCASLTREEIVEQIGSKAWAEVTCRPDPSKRYFESGETLEEQALRVRQGLEECIAGHSENDTIAISTHFTVVACIMATIVESPLRNLWLWGGSGGAANASISTITFRKNRYYLVSFNSTDHLLPL